MYGSRSNEATKWHETNVPHTLCSEGCILCHPRRDPVFESERVVYPPMHHIPQSYYVQWAAKTEEESRAAAALVELATKRPSFKTKVKVPRQIPLVSAKLGSVKRPKAWNKRNVSKS